MIVLDKQEFIKVIVGKKRTYYLFDADSDLIAYELMPSVRNTITLLQQLFGLEYSKGCRDDEKEFKKHQNLPESFIND